MFSNRFGGSVLVLGLALGAIVYAVARAGSSDVNCDGCVDLEDYATLQGEITGPGCVPLGGTAFEPVRSYLTRNVDGSQLLIPVVPGDNGFVVTDVMLDGAFCRRVAVTERNPATGVGELKMILISAHGFISHWNSGIAFTSGMEVWIEPDTDQTCEVVFMSGHTQ